jgi:hypothetical protein
MLAEKYVRSRAKYRTFIDNVRVIYTKRSKFVKNECAEYI